MQASSRSPSTAGSPYSGSEASTRTSPPEDAPTVLVCGAGIAGLALALFLQKEGRFQVRVFERSPELQPALGAHFGLNGALEVLDRAGFRHLWEPLIHEINTMAYWDPSSGRRRESNLGDALKGTDFDRKFGTFMRGELQQALADGLLAGVVQCGKEVAQIDEQKDSVQVHFKDGTSASGDILVGTDGINSAVRKIVFPEIQKVWTGYKVWIMVLDQPPPVHLRNKFSEVYTDHGTIMTFGAGQGPKHIILCARSCPTPPSREEIQEASTVDGFHHMFQETGAYDIGVVTEENLRTANRLMHFPVYSLPHDVTSWSKGRVCLLGDAIHATSPFIGQGANQAVQSAFSLTRLLHEQDIDNYQEVFAELFRIRSPVTSKIIKMSAATARMRIKHEDETCYDGIQRAIYYYMPLLLPRLNARLIARSWKVEV